MSRPMRYYVRSNQQITSSLDIEPLMPACQEAPATESAPDDTPAYLALAREDTQRAIGHLEASDTDTFACQVALDALHDALTAIEAQMSQMEAHHASE